MVFRTPKFDFPLSRGRRSLNLKKDGGLVETKPGPTDRRQAAEGAWRVEGNTLIITTPGQPDRSFEIKSVEAGKLVLRETG